MGMAGNGKVEKSSVLFKRTNLLPKGGSRWTLSDVPSDIVIEVDDECFALHKAHPGLTEIERKKLCKLIDCQKLSQEASRHAGQNERLPVQMVVKVLYMEQLRLRSALEQQHNYSGGDVNTTLVYASQRMHNHPNNTYHHNNSGAPSAAMSPRDNYASLRRENRELKLEIARMRMRLNELEKNQISMKEGFEKSYSSSNGLFSSMTKKLGKMSLFASSKNTSSPKPIEDKKQGKRWRHSLS